MENGGEQAGKEGAGGREVGRERDLLLQISIFLNYSNEQHASFSTSAKRNLKVT